ncbi:MAG: DNA-binding response regulator [SAR86 cluster bacterium]|uniref:DNA-binding response regulator n=1 Tax=SAR86 cluster bacterium TaxID=2030880 RepID=A0A2A5ATZ5_9GAMM|nr:MAG: DNA-binding response regulator [SAR86 cluster bacterium]
MKNHCILIIDDHALFRTGLSMILKLNDHVNMIQEASSVMEALAYEGDHIALILLDIHMPGLNGLNGLKVLQKKFKAIPIIILSASQEAQDVQDAFRYGANGYLQKSAPADEITSAIEKVLKGATCFPENSEFNKKSSAYNPVEDFTPRQLQVLSLLCEGKSNRMIARDLAVAENTVRFHVSSILSVFEVSSRSEAMLAAQQKGLILIK